MSFEDLPIRLEEPAYIISVINPDLVSHRNAEEMEKSRAEMQQLLKTLGIPVVATHFQKKNVIEGATFLGKGWLEEVALKAQGDQVKTLVFDFTLKPGQVRNIKKLTKLEVIDRNNVILEIFAQHAKTSEAKLQIEMAKLSYLLPRLSSYWGHFSKQKGGIGVRSGEGEKQIELDRRMIRHRLKTIQKRLDNLKKTRVEQRKRRKDIALTGALIGYTNVGKSSLLNALCRVDVTAQDKLFATLDSTYRMLSPNTKPPMILIDTVGFISQLPTHLIEGFKSTLESAAEADLLLIISDAADEDCEDKIAVTLNILKDLHLDHQKKLFIFNKIDLVSRPLQLSLLKKKFPQAYFISAQNPDDINDLRKKIIHFFLEDQNFYDLFIPYTAGGIHYTVEAETNVLKRINHEKGIYYRVKTLPEIFSQQQFAKFLLAPQDPMIKKLDQS